MTALQNKVLFSKETVYKLANLQKLLIFCTWTTITGL